MTHTTFDFSLTAQGRGLTMHGPDGSWALPAMWLRERAPDDATLDPTTGQRLIEAGALPLDLAVEQAETDGDWLSVVFSDGHRTRFALDALLP